jgi:hypothetical protein
MSKFANPCACLSSSPLLLRIIAKKNWFTRHETDRFLNNHCQECVRAYLSIHDCLSFLHKVMIGNHRTRKSSNLVSRAYHLHYCVTVLENRIICCQIFCDLLSLKICI